METMKAATRLRSTLSSETVLDTVLDALNILPEDFYFSLQAEIIATTSGTISALSSILVMSIILRSQSRLSTAYHRIMFFMSACDTITSIAIALTTVPMPSDVIFPFAGNSFGNESTCAAQGFLIVLGTMFTIGANCSLNMHYACIYWLGMSQDTIKNKLLPAMFIFWMCICIPAATLPLALGLFNPRPWEPYCYFGSYPPHCSVDDEPYTDIECIGREVSAATENNVLLLYLGLMGLCFLLIFVSLILVVASVFKAERTMKMILQQHPRTTAAEHARANEFAQTRTVLRVALMYILAFFLSWMWWMIAVLFGSIIKGRLIWQIIDHGKILCGPLQGFFNAFIFIYNKMHTLRQSNRNLSFWKALQRIIVSPSEVPEIILSRVEMVDDDNEDRMDRQRDMEDQMERENMDSISNTSGKEPESEISPASIPSDFVSINTPSFAASRVSSSGITQNEGGGDENEGQVPGESKSRIYYTNTPSKLLNFQRTNTTSINNANSSRSNPNEQRNNQGSGGSDVESRSGAGFSLNSLLSGFSTTNTNANEERFEEDFDLSYDSKSKDASKGADQSGL